MNTATVHEILTPEQRKQLLDRVVRRQEVIAVSRWTSIIILFDKQGACVAYGARSVLR